MKKYKIGLIGLGTVGTGVVKALRDFDNIEIKKIAVRDKNKKRDIEGLDYSILTEDAYSIVNDPEIEIVVEVIGGIDPAYDLIKKALENKKHIVTANKELIAKFGNELFKIANENNMVILYEAAIAGGIPIIFPMKTTLAGNKIKKIQAILNGTTNYILTRMSKENASYNEVLEEAQKLGYAESDPTNDVEGYDAAYKICTLATIAFHQRIDINKIYREGIVKVTSTDMEYAKELGYKIKLIAQANIEEDGKIDVRVHPTFVKNDNILANINNVTNAILLEGNPVGEVTFIGPGAGEKPTASSVIGDILILTSELESSSNSPLRIAMCNHKVKAEQIDILDTINEYYILIEAKNTKGVIGTIGQICGNNNISMSTVIQKGIKADNTAQIVVITSESKESDIQKAIRELKEHDNINKIESLLRVIN